MKDILDKQKFEDQMSGLSKKIRDNFNVLGYEIIELKKTKCIAKIEV